MLYLVAVLASATAFGRGPAIVASIAAFVAFDWSFVEPLHQFTVADPQQYVSLLLFLLVAAVTSQLAAEQRARTAQALDREREAVILADIAGLSAAADLRASLVAAAARIQQELDVAAVGILLRGQPPVIAPFSADVERLFRGASSAPANALSPGTAASATAAGRTGRWVRVVSPLPRDERLRRRVHSVAIDAGGAPAGSLIVLRRTGTAPFRATEDRLLAATAAQVGLAEDRARLRDEATESEVLRRSDQLKTALLGAVSHELRTPLASIMASAGSLRQKDVTWSDAERDQFHESIEQEVKRLDRLVGELLDLSRIDAGHLVLQRQYHALDALVDDVLGRLRHTTEAHRIRVDVPEDLPPVSVDYLRIDQVLSNLLENAVRYAPPGTLIEIAGRVENGALRIEVTDEGPGVAGEDRERVFAPFHRLERGDRGPVKGAGLGLAIARRLVEAHGGRIWVEAGPGRGARFVVTLPLEAAEVPR
ncbi:MAG: two-component system, OmpR family, sensor histidine kinase KdpD [Chloroflexota bacterium]|nr:two-component system, OmpR family, sensor histidine kinase KdpD [Chloroflexota bacterium]